MSASSKFFTKESMMSSINDKSLSLSFYACILWIFLEYFRLQEKYSLFYGWPMGKITAFIYLGVFLVEGRGFSYKNSINVYILLFSFWMFITAFTGINTSQSLDKITDIVKMFVIYFLIINTIDNKRQLYIFIVTILLLYFSYTNYSFRLWAAYGFHSGIHGINLGSGYLNNTNDFGAFLCSFWGVSICMILADNRKIFTIKTKWLHVINTLLFFVAILVTSTRGAALGLFAGTVYGVMTGKKKLISLALLIAGILIFVNLLAPVQIDRYRYMAEEEDKTAQQRIENWKAALEMFEDRPVTGVGIGNYVEANQRIYNKNIPFVQHNIYLQALTETGLPGLLIILLIIVAFFKNQREVLRLIRDKNIEDKFYRYLAKGLNMSMISFLVAGFFITVLFYPFLWINLAISVSLRKVVERSVIIET